MDKSEQIEELKAELDMLKYRYDNDRAYAETIIKDLKEKIEDEHSHIMASAEEKMEYAAGAAFEQIVGGKVLNVGCSQLGRISRTEDGSLFIQANGRVGEEPSEWQSIWFHIELPDGRVIAVQVEESECITIGPRSMDERRAIEQLRFDERRKDGE